MKKWGNQEFWGLSADYDPDWVLTPEQLELRDKLIELCRTVIRPKAIECDREYKFPRESLDSLATLGLFGLVVPKELGGLGQNHVCCGMVIETIARYGCPSTALVFCMHIVATSMVLFGHSTNSYLKNVLRRVNKDKILMTTVHSDPATGGHFWFPFTSKSKFLDDNSLRLFKYGSWVTSAGYADMYAATITSPEFGGDHTKLTNVLLKKEEVRAFSQDWSALGMHGNMSAELVCDTTIPKERIIGDIGDGGKCNDESAASFFYIMAPACFNGIAMACLDTAKKYVTRKSHADVGMRISDYAVIQDYFGASICSTNISRLSVIQTSQRLDQLTNNNDYINFCRKTTEMKRTSMALWQMQVKHMASENASTVADTIMKACGGVGYKTELGLERLLRDSKAGSVMAPSNEFIRSLMGKSILLGMESLDLWEQVPNKRMVNHEISKMTSAEKKELAETLLNDVKTAEASLPIVARDEDFDNPFNVSPPKYIGKIFEAHGVTYHSALTPNDWTQLKLSSISNICENAISFVFSLPEESNHSGLIPGQYIKVRVNTENHGTHERYFSPVSIPGDPKKLELILRLESHGIVSQYFQNMTPGASLEFQGPSGGFEYHSGRVKTLTLLTAGGAVTPALQLIRSIASDPLDKTNVLLLFYSNNLQQIIAKEELDQIAKSQANVKVCYTLGEAPQDWNEEEGFIDAAMLKKHMAHDTTDAHKVVICGGVNMSLTCCYALRSMGIRSSQVFVYGISGAEVIRRVYGRTADLSSHSLLP